VSDTPEASPEIPKKTIRDRHQARRPMSQRAKTGNSARGSRPSSNSDSTQSSSYVDLVNVFAEGVKKALRDSRELLVGIEVEAIETVKAKERKDAPKEKRYHDRSHDMKFILEMVWFVVAFAILTALIFPAMWISAANYQDNGMMIAFIYIGLCLVLAYLAAFEHFRWAELYYIREGGVLRAVRRGNNWFLLAPIDSVLILKNVVGIDETASWLARRFAISRIIITQQDSPNQAAQPEDTQSPTDNERRSLLGWLFGWLRPRPKPYNFKLLKWVKNGNDLIEAVKEGISKS